MADVNRNRVKLTGIDASAFQHPLDREATAQLKKLYGFDVLVAKFLELRYERLLYVFNIASNIRVGPHQFPKLYGMLRECCAVLDIPEPELYVSQNPTVNAFTFGYTNPYVVLYTGLLDLMNDEETLAVVAHELGHIKCGHHLYSTMAYSIRDIATLVGQATLGLGQIIWLSIEAALLTWRRRSELSADRAALLALQDPTPCISLLAKLAGGSLKLMPELNAEEFLRQAATYDAELDRGMLDRFYRVWAEATQGTHPFAVERARELNLWVNGSEYQDILAGNYPRGVRKIQIKVEPGPSGP
jgi:Zn-dependent protease with chaperone function